MAYHEIDDPEQLQALLDAVLLIESNLELNGVLRRIVEAACSLTGARYGALGVLDAERKGLAEFVTVGLDAETASGIEHPPVGEGILGLLIIEPHPLRLSDIASHPDSVGFPKGHPPMKSFLGVPLRVRQEVYGNLYLTEKEGAAEFSAGDEALVEALAATAGIAVDHASLQARLSELTLATDRERIARDLHDTVIQQLFAVGLSLQSAIPLTEVATVRRRIEEAISDLDDTIRQVRTTIFALEPAAVGLKGLRSRVLDLCSESSRSLGFDPRVRFSGALDRTVGERVAAELLATLREALANVARHAAAQMVEVELVLDDGLVELVVRDDGVGTPESPRRGEGLSNMTGRASDLGGSFSLTRVESGGSELCWSVPAREPR